MNYDSEKYEYIQVNFFNFFKKKGRLTPKSDIYTLGFDGWELINCEESIISGTNFEFRRIKNIDERKIYLLRDFSFSEMSIINISFPTKIEEFITERLTSEDDEEWNKVSLNGLGFKKSYLVREVHISEFYSVFILFLKDLKDEGIIEEDDFKKIMDKNHYNQKTYKNLSQITQFNIFIDHLLAFAVKYY